MIPSEYPDHAHLGEAFPPHAAPGREAILQPPKPQIRSAAKILLAAREREVATEAAS